MQAIFRRGLAIEKDQYQKIFTSSNSATPFQSWEWVTAWKEVFAPGSIFSVFVHHGDELVGFWAGVQKFSSAATLGTGVSDYLLPLALPGHETEVLSQILTLFEGHGKTIDLHQIPSQYAPCTPQAWHQATCPRTQLPSSFEDYLRSLSKSLRYDIRKGFKNHDLTFEDVKPGDGHRFLNELFRLHKLRWKEKHLPGAFGKKAQAFHRHYFSLGAESMRPVLLWNGDKVIGALYVLTNKGISYYYQAGFDPSARSLSPGNLMIAYSIRSAIERGDTIFDFCRGDEAYKRRWATESHSNVRIVSGPGRIALGQLNKLELKVRRLFES